MAVVIAGIPGANALASGFLAGWVGSGFNLKGAVMGAFSAAIFTGIGDVFQASSGFLTKDGLGHIFAHGITGGVLSILQGGKFGHGFISAGLTKAASPYIDAIPSKSSRVIAAAIVGGTTSKLTGGKFANGAVTAAFARQYNDEGEHGNKQNNVIENNNKGRAKEQLTIKQIREMGYKVVSGAKIFIRYGDGKGIAAIADFVYVVDNTVVFGEIKAGDNARFSKNQKAVYDALLKGRVEFKSQAKMIELGIQKGLQGGVGYKVGLAVFADAGSRAIRQSNTLWAKTAANVSAKKVIAGAFTILGSTAASGAEMLLHSPKAGEGSDCPRCLSNF